MRRSTLAICALLMVATSGCDQVNTAKAKLKLAWDKVRRLPRRAIVVITPSADPDWVHLLQAVRGRRTTLIVFYIDGVSFGGPDKNPTFDLGQDVDLYVVRKGDDFARLMRTRDAVRIA